MNLIEFTYFRFFNSGFNGWSSPSDRKLTATLWLSLIFLFNSCTVILAIELFFDVQIMSLAFSKVNVIILAAIVLIANLYTLQRRHKQIEEEYQILNNKQIFKFRLLYIGYLITSATFFLLVLIATKK